MALLAPDDATEGASARGSGHSQVSLARRKAVHAATRRLSGERETAPLRAAHYGPLRGVSQGAPVSDPTPPFGVAIVGHGTKRHLSNPPGALNVRSGVWVRLPLRVPRRKAPKGTMEKEKFTIVPNGTWNRTEEFQGVSDRSESHRLALELLGSKAHDSAVERPLRDAKRIVRDGEKRAKAALSDARKADRAADDAATEARKAEVLDTYVAARARGLTPKGTPRSATLADRKPSAKDERRNRAAMARSPMVRAIQPTTTFRSLVVDLDYEVSGRVYVPEGKD